MKTYSNLAGRTFSITVTVKTIKMVRDQFGFDLSKIFDGQSKLAIIADDPFQTCELLYACSTPCGGEKPTFDEFVEQVGGEEIENAMGAFLEAVVDFFPNQRRRTALMSLVKKSAMMADQRIETAANRIESLTLQEFSNLLTNSPAPLELIPETSLSES